MIKNLFLFNIRSSILIILFVVINVSFSHAQNNSLVLNGAYMVMNGGTEQKPIYLVVNQNSPTAIMRTSGHVISEGQYNFMKWEVGADTGSYVVPFGADNNFIPVTFNKTSNDNISLQLSTWGTDVQNDPKPGISNVNPVTQMTGITDAENFAIDRFWDIRAGSTTTADLTFSYLGIENTTINPNYNVNLQRWNGTAWENPVVSNSLGVTSGVGLAGPFLGQNDFSPFVLLVNEEKNSINENYLDTQILLYPNPTADEVLVSIKGNDKIEKITVFDALGSEIYNLKDIFKTSQIIDFNSLSKGVYFVKIKTQNGFAGRKVIKQ